MTFLQLYAKLKPTNYFYKDYRNLWSFIICIKTMSQETDGYMPSLYELQESYLMPFKASRGINTKVIIMRYK